MVLITRPEAISTELEARLAARGQVLLEQSLLQTRPLPADLLALDKYQAVIASSGVAVAILADRTSGQPGIRSCKLYVVGSAAARAAAAAGFERVQYAPTANALAMQIRADLSPADGPLLYAAGVHRARDMRRLLSAFTLDLVELYAAEKVGTLDPDVCHALRQGDVSQIAFYSARAVDAFVAAAGRAGVLRQARSTVALCLSPRIAARLRAHGWRKTWAAPQPAAALIEARLTGSHAARSAPLLAEPDLPAAPAAIVSEPLSSPSPAAMAATEEPMTSPAPTTPTEDARAAPGWPAVIGVAVLAAFFAGAVWYFSNDRTKELQAEVSGLRAQLSALDLDPGKAERTALAARAEEAAKIASALAGVAERAAEKATVERLADQVQGLTARTDSAIQALSAKTSADMQTLQSAQQQAEAKDTAQTASLDTLGGKVAALESRIAKVEGWAGGTPPAQLAEQLIALSELRRVIDNGIPFANALTRARDAVPAVAAAKGGWLDRASEGIPSYAGLAGQLTKIEKKLPLPKSDASGNAAVNSALGVLLSGIRVEGQGALVDDPNRNAVAAARKALAAGDAKAADEAMAAVAGNNKALDEWRADLAARMQADAAISKWEANILASVSGSSK
jgi:uroporphyrinogen-III synthase